VSFAVLLTSIATLHILMYFHDQTDQNNDDDDDDGEVVVMVVVAMTMTIIQTNGKMTKILSLY